MDIRAAKLHRHELKRAAKRKRLKLMGRIYHGRSKGASRTAEYDLPFLLPFALFRRWLTFEKSKGGAARSAHRGI